MGHDRFGCALTTRSPEAVAAWDAMALSFLAHGADAPVHLAAALEADPDLAAAHAAKGLFSLMLGRRELVEVARGALDAARRSVGANPVSPREAGYLEALGAWLDGHPAAAVDRIEAALLREPNDALALKIGHAIRFVLGDACGMRASIEAALPAYGADHPARGYVLGCHAFALEETGEHSLAEARGRAGLEAAADDAWGLHAVAHVHDMRGNAAAGLAWLDGREAAWAHCNNFRYHVWWHRALMLLDLGRSGEALALYDAEIRAERTDDYRDLSNAASLLMRLELDGVAVGDRWEELADLSERRSGDGCLVFADLHYMLALIGGRREGAAATLLARISRDAAADDRMARPGLPAAAGLVAFGEGHHGASFDRLLAARPAMQRAGGSHAQRDVFERVTIEAGLRAGRLDGAEAVLADRLRRRGGREDGYHAARMALVAQARAEAAAVPAAERGGGAWRDAGAAG
jgi:hypothetical protein